MNSSIGSYGRMAFMSMKKRILLTFAALIVITTVTLALTPHYGCACGQDLKDAKPPISKLTFLVRWILK